MCERALHPVWVLWFGGTLHGTQGGGGSGSPDKETKWPVMRSGTLGLDQRSEAAAEPGDP